MVALTDIATDPQKRTQLFCQNLLLGETREAARKEAAVDLERILGNTQIVAIYGNDALDGVNRLNDRMLNERHPVEVPELRDLMRNLSRQMRGLGNKYDPSDPHVREKYEKARDNIFVKLRWAKSFLEEFLDDIKSTQQQFDQVVNTLEDKQEPLLRNIVYYDQYYLLNQQELGSLIYVIGKMEMMCEELRERASKIVVGNAQLGDQGGEQKARLLELALHIENKAVAFSVRLCTAWAMYPIIRNLRSVNLGVSLRINQTIDITIPTMKGTIVVWLSLNDAQVAEQFNRAVEDAANEVMVMFAKAAGAAVPMMANAMASTALHPATIKAWSDSVAAQADGIIAALDTRDQAITEMYQAITESMGVVDTSTNRVNDAMYEHVIARGQKALQIATSVPAQS